MSRELNISMAERVMGWKVYQGSARQGLGLSDTDYHLEWLNWSDDPANYPYIDESGSRLVVWRKPREDGATWSPSSCISDAWDVVLAIEQLGYWVRMETPHRVLSGAKYSGYWCEFVERHTQLPENWTRGETMPMAICRAALKAIGEQNE